MKLSLLFGIYFFYCSSTFAQKITLIKCDSIYKNKQISLKLVRFDNQIEGYDNDTNSVFSIIKKVKNKNSTLLRDSIFSSVQEIEFKDFNNDNIKDILVQNISDARSNWTYNLYLYNSKTNSFNKVIGFEEIKNPSYNFKYNIIESHVVSGKNWVGFYKIKNNKVYDYKIEIVDDGSIKAEKEYQKAIKKISLKK